MKYDNIPVTTFAATEANKEAYGFAHGAETLGLTAEQIVALCAGKMLALPINLGEYVLFIVNREATEATLTAPPEPGEE